MTSVSLWQETASGSAGFCCICELELLRFEINVMFIFGSGCGIKKVDNIIVFAIE